MNTETHDRAIAAAFEKLERLIKRNQILRDALRNLVDPDQYGHQVGPEARRFVAAALNIDTRKEGKS